MSVTLVKRPDTGHGPNYVVKSSRRVSLLPEEADENRRRAAGMRRQNYTINEIALQLGVSSRTVSRYLAWNRQHNQTAA